MRVEEYDVEPACPHTHVERRVAKERPYARCCSCSLIFVPAFAAGFLADPFANQEDSK